MKNLKYKIITYGCQMNLHESEKAAGILENLGYSETNDDKQADLILFNTCCIRDNAENHTKEFEHTIPMLKQLKDAWYKIWLISNCSVFALEHVKEKTSILNYIDYPLFSFDAWTIKPDLKIYKKMLEISWCKPEETIMIWDKMWDDVLPPKQLGMNSLLYENYEQLKRDLLDYGIVLK